MLMRWDPFREFDRLAEELWNVPSGRRSPSMRAMAMDAHREGDRFIVQFDLPGVDPDSIDITVEDKTLTVSARREWDRHEDHEWVVSERYQGSFQRQLFLGDQLDADRIEAHYEDGVLALTIPVAEAAKPRRIEVGRSSRAIDAGSHAA